MKQWCGFGLRSIVVAVLGALAGCQPAPAVQVAQPNPVSADGVGYVLFEAAITPLSRDLLIADIDKLRLRGATTICLGIVSPGGQIDAAQGIVDAMAREHAQHGLTFKAYNVSLVASAATYVFLNAQERYTAPNGIFLFHAAGVVSTGMVTSQTLREQADRLDLYERAIHATLIARTKLSDADATTYVRRTVVLNADDARRDGVVDGIAMFAPPKGGGTWVIRQTPPPGTLPHPPQSNDRPPGS